MKKPASSSTYFSNEIMVNSVLNMNYGSGVLPSHNRELNIKYDFDNKILNNYSGGDFAFIVEDNWGWGFKKQVFFQKNINSGITTGYINFSYDDLQKKMPEYCLRKINEIVNLNFKLTLVYLLNQNFVEIASDIQYVSKRDYIAAFEDRRTVSVSGGLVFKPVQKNILSNQSANTTRIFTYYRELGSKTAYSFIEAMPLKDLYGATVAGAFDIDYSSRLDPNKKYEIQYVSYAGPNVINRQQGTLHGLQIVKLVFQ